MFEAIVKRIFGSREKSSSSTELSEIIKEMETAVDNGDAFIIKNWYGRDYVNVGGKQEIVDDYIKRALKNEYKMKGRRYCKQCEKESRFNHHLSQDGTIKASST